MKKVLYLLLVLSMAVFLSACDTGEVDAGDVVPFEPQQEVGDDDVDDLDDIEDDVDDVGAGEAYHDFQNQLQDVPEYIAEYEIVRGSDDIDAVTIYTKGGNSRMDFKYDDVIAWLNDETIVKYEEQCLDFSAASGLGFNPEALYEVASIEGTFISEDEYVSAEYVGTMAMIGRTVDCYEFIYDSSIYNRMTTYCLSEEGAPVLIETVERGTGELISRAKASSLETTVSDDILEPCDVDLDISGMI